MCSGRLGGLGPQTIGPETLGESEASIFEPVCTHHCKSDNAGTNQKDWPKLWPRAGADLAWLNGKVIKKMLQMGISLC